MLIVLSRAAGIIANDQIRHQNLHSESRGKLTSDVLAH